MLADGLWDEIVSRTQTSYWRIGQQRTFLAFCTPRRRKARIPRRLETVNSCLLCSNRTADGRQANFVDYRSIRRSRCCPLLQTALDAAIERVDLLKCRARRAKMRVMDECATYRNTFSNWRVFIAPIGLALGATRSVLGPFRVCGDASFK